MTRKLEKKVAIITGASAGIGEATAIALAAEGAKVALVARRGDRLEALAQRITSTGGEALTYTSASKLLGKYWLDRHSGGARYPDPPQSAVS